MGFLLCENINSIRQSRTSALFLWFLFAGVSFPSTIPAGTEVQVRLSTEVSSQQPSGQAVSAVVLVPVIIDGRVVINAGTKLTGNTADVKPAEPAAEQQPEKLAQLRIQFRKIEAENGKAEPLYAVVTAVDNSREEVDESGLVNGIAGSKTYTGMIDQGISKVATRYGDFAQILSGIKNSVVKRADTSIDYKPGVELTLKLTRALEWNQPPVQNAVGEIAPADPLVQLVNAQPFRTSALKPPAPSDITNLMFIGTAEQLSAAFLKSGWFSADPLGQASTMETARAIIENRGYNEAPVSLLTLENRPPDLVFQKQNDTFAMRHHIRIWQRPQTFEGQPVWVGAATHDIKIAYSQESRSFTHGIDPNIDRERSKVVNDLLFGGLVRAIALVDRTGIPQQLSNATGDQLITDGRMAVMQLQSK